MLKIVMGNLLFAGCVAAWYYYVQGERVLVLSGTFMAFGCFLSGIFMGYLLRGPPKKARGVYSGSSRSFAASPGAVDDDAAEDAPVEDEPAEFPPGAEPDDAVDFEMPTEPVEPLAEPVEIQPIEQAPQPSPLFRSFADTPMPPTPVDIHELAAKVVVDSDGCYEMSVKERPAAFVIDQDDIIQTTKATAKANSISPSAEMTPDTSDFTL
ncbi:MAG TPA: hypothetical protein VG326_01465 [Tepidisphaeraceae bacterium]|jgi:hypothetical protein|nr:hypothetical protein [Tepidisphaeraceae bacterium]